MNLKFLASFLLLCAVVLYSTKRSDKVQEQAERNFWNKERRANSVRKKSLDALNYITIPDTILNMKPLSMTEEIRDYLALVNEIVRVHEGSIEIKGNRAGGTDFEIEF